MVYDVIVVGGGAAGMTAALYALRNGKTVMILEKEGFGGQITHSPKVENFPGTLSMSGNEFADKLFDQILAQGAEFEIDDVVSVEDGEVKTVRTADGNDYEGLTVILATGVKHRVLGVEGHCRLWFQRWHILVSGIRLSLLFSSSIVLKNSVIIVHRYLFEKCFFGI